MVAQDFLLYNAQWPDHVMYMPAISVAVQMGVTNWVKYEKQGAKFNLYKLPGALPNSTKKYYFLTSVKWPNWVAALRTTESTPQAIVSPISLYGLNLDNAGPSRDPKGLVVHVCRANETGLEDA